jgi:DNA-binding response OmpR family regulator
MPTVLVVDDMLEIRELLESALKDWGHEAILAANAAVARDLAERRRIDLALVDCILPTGSGFSLATRLKSAGVPVILMSGDPNAMRQLVAFGCPYLCKPFHLSELRALIIDTMAAPAAAAEPAAGDVAL